MKIAKTLRMLGLILLLTLACFGVGITGHFLPTQRDKYRDTEIKIERIDKRKEDEEEADESG